MQHFDFSLNAFLDVLVLIEFVFVVDLQCDSESGLNVHCLSDHCVGALTQELAEFVLIHLSEVKCS